jgi:DNA-binding transcriptional LysR family regulator
LENVPLKALQTTPLVDYLPHSPVARMWFKHHFGKLPTHLEVAYSAESVRAVLTAIANDIGIGVVPKHLLTGEFKTLRVIETKKRPFVNLIVIARRIGAQPTARESEFLRFYRKEAVTQLQD